MNHHAILAIYRFEMNRTWRTLLQSVVAPVISTSLYFVVFGAALGSRLARVDGVGYGAFIVPGIWADSFEKLNLVPLLIVTPLTFLGGSFYSIAMLPPFWRSVTLFNPVVYLVSGFRWSFFGTSDIEPGISLGMTVLFMTACLAGIFWIFKTGYRLKR